MPRHLVTTSALDELMPRHTDVGGALDYVMPRHLAMGSGADGWMPRHLAMGSGANAVMPWVMPVWNEVDAAVLTTPECWLTSAKKAEHVQKLLLDRLMVIGTAP